MNPHLEKIYNQITIDLSTGLFKLLNDYPGHELEMVRLMTAQLGSLIAVASKDPAQALVYYANRLAQFQWQEVRSDYFANTLGVDTTRPTRRAAMAPVKPMSEVVRIESARERMADGGGARPGPGPDGDPADRDDCGSISIAAHTGDPRQKKPD